MIKNRIEAIESRRAVKNKPRGLFQVIKSDKDLKKSKRQIEAAQAKCPNIKIPCFRIILENASKRQKHRNTETNKC